MNNNQSVRSVTRSIIERVNHQQDTAYGKATLAQIRKIVGKPLQEAVEVWPILFSNLPDVFLSSYAQPSNEELAIYTALQLYALQAQGTKVLMQQEDTKKYQNIGHSLSVLRREVDTTALDRRFNVMITATTFEELTYHLRHLLQLLKAKAPTVKVDYPTLAEDLYWFLKDSQEAVRLNWAREYYKQYVKGEENNDN